MARFPRFSRPSPWTALVPVVALAAGLLFATSSRTALGTDLRAGESSQLSGLIEQRDAAVARQQDELAGLQQQVQALTDQAASRNGAVAAAQAEGEQGLASAGLTAVSGPGLSVTLDDAPAQAGGGLPSASQTYRRTFPRGRPIGCPATIPSSGTGCVEARMVPSVGP